MEDIKKDKQNTKAVILEAAEAEFLEHGFHGTTTAAIAKRAGVNHAMLHYYFSTKENLFEMFISSKMQTVKNIAFPVLMSEGQDIFERIKLLIDKQFDYLIKHPSLPKFMLNEVLSKPERFRQLIHSVLMSDMVSFNTIRTDLEAEIEAGRIRPITLPDLVLDVMSMNIMSFVLKPIVQVLPGVGMDEAAFLECRRNEIKEVMIRRLTK